MRYIKWSIECQHQDEEGKYAVDLWLNKKPELAKTEGNKLIYNSKSSAGNGTNEMQSSLELNKTFLCLANEKQ